MRPRSLAILAAAAASFMVTPPASATTYYVSHGCSDDQWSGTTLQCSPLLQQGPKRTIQGAIDAAADGDTIIIQLGTYHETLDTLGKSLVIRGPAGPEHTIIDAQQSGSVLLAQGGNLQLEGVTITGGRWSPGGGLRSEGCDLRLLNCHILSNETPSAGGGVYVFGGTIFIDGCRFALNLADAQGGGLWVGYATGDISNCTFEANDVAKGEGPGGAALSLAGSDVTVRRCQFMNNGGNQVVNGGAISSRSSLTLIACTFIGNTCVNHGSAIYAASGDLVLESCLLASNQGPRNTVSIGSEVSLDAINCTFANNDNPNEGAITTFGTFVDVRNCICWGSGDFIVAPLDAPARVRFSNVEGGWTGAGSGNISVDPHFADPGANNFALRPGSSCIDAADARAVRGLADLADQLRAVNDPDTSDTGITFAGLAADMGCFEFQPGSPPNACPADLTGDDVVNVFDLLDLLSAWGACP